MMTGKYLSVAVLLLLFSAGCTSVYPPANLNTGGAPDANDFDYSSYAALLDRYVNTQGLVDYAGLSRNQRDVGSFYRQIAAFSPDSHPHLFGDENARLAYWINSYNFTAIAGVLHNYPITSVADVKPPPLFFFFPSKSGFFFFQRFTYGGVETSLYYLENKVIRKRFSDPRYHFGLNCASRSCPELPKVPFYPDRLDEQLDAEAAYFINDKRNVRYDRQEKILYLSSIFDWYEKDFLDWLKDRISGQQPTIADYILLYLDDEDADLINKDRTSLAIRYLPYDWALNDAAESTPK
jgi:hypothetical protein